MKKAITLMAAVLVAATTLLVTAVPVLACIPSTQLTMSASASEVSPGGSVQLDIRERNTSTDVQPGSASGDLYGVYVELSDGTSTVILNELSGSFVGTDAGRTGILDLDEEWRWLVTWPVNGNITITAIGHGIYDDVGGIPPVDITYPAYASEQAQVSVTVQGGEGCTPGYWKNNAINWGAVSWVGYTPGRSLESVFDVPDSLGLDSKTLLQALQFQGGPRVLGASQILLRAGVAALLNAANPNINYVTNDTQDVIDAINWALASGDRPTILWVASVIDGFNNAGCSIDMHGNPI